MEGLTPLHEAAIFGAGQQIMRCLIAARAAVDAQYAPRRGTPVWTVLSVLDMSYRLGSRSFLRSMAHHSWNATPLMYAVITNRRAEIQLLLAARADVDVRNQRGCTARALASMFGTMGISPPVAEKSSTEDGGVELLC